MKPGSVSFIGFAGMRLIDASLDMDVSFKDDVTIEGILPSSNSNATSPMKPVRPGTTPGFNPLWA